MIQVHQREVAIFDAALQLPPDQRDAYLQQTCGGDPGLLQRIRALLNADEGQTDFLAPASTLIASPPPTEKPGDRIGPYKLLQLIGEGGCGLVYMAEQEQPIRRRVALKIIKLGMDTRQVIARFEAERQALALMDHPSIAKVHDAGATATGRPYFVMELVRGVKITDYCDEKKLSTQQRLELFIQVCQAVQHAHQKGIIHRDLKPSNILVAANDGVAVAKVIDFGIAKATTGERLTDKTLFTAFEQFIGTPAYMSPEQAEVTNVDIDTRSDIYSLGVLLYELLTGQTPFDAKELLQAGLGEMRRTLREKEPPRPSTRLSTMGAEALTNTAHRRGLEAPRLVSLLRGDLDWIVMKCLEKDRARRYETAHGLALDIQRHLAEEPVLARPPGNLYRFRKMVRRHKQAAGALGAIFAMLIVALVLSTMLLLQERQARRFAEAAEKQARLSELIAKTEECYARMDRTAAVATAHQAIALQKRLSGAEHPQVVTLLNNFGSAAVFRRWFEDAEPMLREALAIRRGRLGNDHPEIVDSLCRLAVLSLNRGDRHQAEACWREGLMMQARLWPSEPEKWRSTLFNLSNLLRNQNRFAEVDELVTELLARPHLSGSPLLRGLRGYYRAETGRWQEAEADLEAAVQSDVSDSENWAALGLVHLETGGQREYQESCRAMVSAIGNSTNRPSRWAPSLVLLLPSALGTNDVETASRIALRASTNSTTQSRHWLHFTQGLIAYRASRFEDALKYMRLVQQDIHVDEPDGTLDECEADSYLLTAMALQKMRLPQEAAAALGRGSQLVNLRVPALNAADLGSHWPDVLMTHIWFKEAKEQVEGTNISGQPNTPQVGP